MYIYPIEIFSYMYDTHREYATKFMTTMFHKDVNNHGMWIVINIKVTQYILD